MMKRLIRHGNSAALVIGKALLGTLNVTMDTRNIIISPQSDADGESDVLEGRVRRGIPAAVTAGVAGVGQHWIDAIVWTLDHLRTV